MLRLPLQRLFRLPTRIGKVAVRWLLCLAAVIASVFMLRGCPTSEEEARERVDSLLRLKLPKDARIIYSKRQELGDVYHISVPKASFPTLSSSRREDYTEWSPAAMNYRFEAGKVLIEAKHPGAVFSRGGSYGGQTGGGRWPVLIWHEDRELLFALVCSAQGG